MPIPNETPLIISTNQYPFFSLSLSVFLSALDIHLCLVIYYLFNTTE